MPDRTSSTASEAASRHAPPPAPGRRLVRLLSGDFWGIEGRPVEVQIDVSMHASPGFNIVGLPSKSTRESRERIRAAIQNSGFFFPHEDHILVNLAPAFQKKDGAVFDLAVAMGILLATAQVPHPAMGESEILPVGFLGELGLEGELRQVPGALLIASALRSKGVHRLIVAESNAAEVILARGVEAYPARDLHQAIAALGGRVPPYQRPAGEAAGGERTQSGSEAGTDFIEVRGQESTKRGILAAAAGGHHLFLMGPPGVGKTMLARRIPGILPPLGFEESLEVTRIYSAAGLLHSKGPIGARPFRAPHHTISYAGLVGGGNPPRPGEISLAHCGVLFLDELPEFPRKVLETLRQPLECGQIVIGRSTGSVAFPARFLVVAAMNPCPCGYAGYSNPPCRCTPAMVESYRQRLSGPLLDRIDLFLEVAQPSPQEVLRPRGERRSSAGLSTTAMRQAVVQAREIQAGRWGQPLLNSQAPHDLLLQRGRFEDAALERLTQEAQRRGISARGLGRVLRIARTLADLEASAAVQEGHILEALLLRRPEAPARNC